MICLEDGVSWGLGSNLSSYHRRSSFPAQLESGPSYDTPPTAHLLLAGTFVLADASFLDPGENKGILKFSWHHIQLL